MKFLIIQDMKKMRKWREYWTRLIYGISTFPIILALTDFIDDWILERRNPRIDP